VKELGQLIQRDGQTVRDNNQQILYGGKFCLF